jgi:transglutaminase-like putative cysteine protease
LIAMLRAAGVPARYRHGTLNPTQAKTLIASLFPAVSGVAGYVPIGTPVADPVNDATLIVLASDHWWVEAYLPDSGWTDLDPTYPQATAGQAFATPLNDGTDRAADVPSGVHHTLRVRLKRE